MPSQFILGLITASFIGGVAGYLGSLMISKRMALVGGPLGHLALPGVALSLIYHSNIFLGALLSISLGAVIIWWLKTKTKLSIEALTGLVFAAGVALGFLILPLSQAEEALIGDITKVNPIDTILAVILGLVIFFVIKKIYQKMVLLEISEDLAKTEGVNVKRYNLIYLISLGLMVALEVKIVGILLTAALFIIPAASARNISTTLGQYGLFSLIIGMVSAILGMFLFKLTQVPAGPLIILVNTSVFIISIFLKSE
ncbi:metal ABC transporter permease [bacterium]|nr:metal ABC transporter permease [bacterium]